MEFVVNAYIRQQSYQVSAKMATILAAMAFALATLTRAVSVLFPLVLVMHLILLGRQRPGISVRKLSLLLTVVYAATASTWTIYNYVLWDRVVIVSDQFLPALWRGAETQDGSPKENDALLLQDKEVVTNDDCQPDCKYQHPPELYIERIGTIVEADAAGFFKRRLIELTNSLVYPHGTTGLGRVSIRDSADDIFRQNGLLDGLPKLLKIDGFLAKAAIWLFHVAAIAAGLVGMWLSRRQMRIAFPLVGFVLYTLAAHFFLLALPRYLFPLELVWLIFAGIGVVIIYDRTRREASADHLLTS